MAEGEKGQGRGKPRKRTGGAQSGRGQSGAGDRSGAKRSGGKGRAGGRGGKGRGADDPAAQLTGPLKRVLDRLPETQREVLEWRMGLKDGYPRKLTDTAREMGLSMSEAREIEQRAFEHIREAVPLEHLQKYLQQG